MNKRWAGLLAALAAPLHAAGLDCAALANDPGLEPAGHARACLAAPVPTPWSVSWLDGAGTVNPGYAVQLTPLDGMRPQGLYQFTPPAFDLVTRLGEASDTPNMFGLDFNTASTRLYGVQTLTGGVAIRLGTFNFSTGAFAPTALVLGTGTTREQITGLTIDPRTGQAWVTSVTILTNNPQLAESRLYSMSLSSGILAPVGRLLPDELNPVFIDLAMDCNGNLIGHNITDDALYEIDPENAEATLIGSHGVPANFAQGMDFDNTTDQLYGWLYTGGGNNTFGRFDLGTAAYTELATGQPGQWEGALSGTCSRMPIDADALTGGWYASYSSGQGFTARYFADSGLVFMPWYTFSTEGGEEADQQRWYVLYGQLDADNSTETELQMPIYRTVGGLFDAPAPVTSEPVGMATLSFMSCSEGVLEYQFDPAFNDGAQGRLSMTRLLPLGSDCTDYDGAEQEAQREYDPDLTGSWYDPETAGQGLELFRAENNDDQVGLLYGAWFTFAPAEEPEGEGGPETTQRWFTIEGQSVDADGVITAIILRTLGGTFDSEPPVAAASIGTVQFTSKSCDELTMAYTFDDSEDLDEFRDLEGEITFRRLGACEPGEE